MATLNTPSRNAPKASFSEGPTVLTRWDSARKRGLRVLTRRCLSCCHRGGGGGGSWMTKAAGRMTEVREGPSVLRLEVPGCSAGALLSFLSGQKALAALRARSVGHGPTSVTRHAEGCRHITRLPWSPAPAPPLFQTFWHYLCLGMARVTEATAAGLWGSRPVCYGGRWCQR